MAMAAVATLSLSGLCLAPSSTAIRSSRSSPYGRVLRFSHPRRTNVKSSYAPRLPATPFIGTQPRKRQVFSATRNESKASNVRASAAAGVASVGTAPAEEPKKAPVWEGAAPLPAALSIGLGLALRFLVPRPAGITPQAWQLLSIFLSTITGLVLSPLPVGAWAFLGLTTTVLTKTLTFKAAFSAFTNDVIWLIVISFFFARGFVKTGLGNRVATYFVKWLGSSTLGLSYGLVVAEALISPAMPSTTARAGGVFLPIIRSLSAAAGSTPEKGTERKLGAYLIQSQLQAGGASSALFLTAAAQNLLCLKLAQELGVFVAGPWLLWARAGILPALASLLTIPYIVYKLYPPGDKDTPDAPKVAEQRLKALGPLTKDEWVMIGVMLLAVTLWIFGDSLGVASVVAGMIGLSALLFFGVLKWDDCLAEKSAWDTLAWFAILVGMSAQLNHLGLVKYLSDSVAANLAALNLTWPASLALLQGIYFAVHYLFASQTAQVGALYPAFLAMAMSTGVPPLLAILSFGYNTNLFGALTHYSSGQAAVYFGAGYTSLPDAFRLGAICALWNYGVFAVVGAAWWKFIGLY